MKKAISIALFFLLHFVLNAQIQNAFDRYTVESGLSQSSVTSIMQDKKGFMWFATLDGLNKFDGYDFQVFRSNPTNGKSIGESFIYSVFVDRTEKIWIGLNSGGVSVFDPNTNHFKTYTTSQGLSSNNVTSIAQDSKGRIWLGTSRGLSCFMNGKFVDLKKEFHLGRAHLALEINKIYIVDDVLWGATNYGFFRFNISNSVWQHFIQKNVENLPSDGVNDLYVENNSKVYIATNKGFCLYQTKGKTHEIHDPIGESGFINPLKNIRTTAITADQDGVIWIGTEGYGLYNYIPATQSFFVSKKDASEKQSISSNTILSLFVDKTNAVWIGTSLGGVNRLNRRKERFVTLRHNPYYKHSISSNRVRCIYEDNVGKVWVGTEEGGFCEWNIYNNTFVTYKKDLNNANSLSNDNVRSIVRDADGVIWLGTEGGGLNEFNLKTGKFKQYVNNEENPNSLPSDKIWKLFIDSKQTMWVGTVDGLSIFDKKKGTFRTFKNEVGNAKSLSQNHIVEIFEDSRNNIWIGTYEGGLNLWNAADSSFIRYPVNNNNIKIDRIYAIMEDSEGILWFASRSALRKYNPQNGTFTFFNVFDYNFPNQVLMGLLDDDKGNLWISSNAGLIKFNKKTANIRSFRSTEGLQSEEYMIGAFCKLTNGKMVFGGVNGMDVFKAENITDNSFIPDVLITSIKVQNRELKTDTAVSDKKFIELSYEQNVISFDFVALNYQFAHKNKYAFMLEGFDKDWIECGTRRFANYTNLPPGNYVFKVKASNNDDIWNETGTMIDIHIKSPFWQSKIFQFIVLILFVLLTYLIIKTRDFVRDKNKLEKTVRERTKEIVQQNEEIESQKDEISIQRDIANQQKEEIESQRDELENKQRELERSYTNIRLLSRVGQSIIAHLLEEEIVETAYYRLIPLIRFDIFTIGLVNEEGTALVFDYNYDRKGRIDAYSEQLSNNNSISVWSFKNSKPVIINNLEDEYLDYIDELPNDLPHNNPRVSILCMPLKAGEEHLGVIAVLKSQVGAFRDYHLNVIRNLAIYITIALKNSRSYLQIEKQKQLIESKKDELQHLNATKDKFFSIVSHDLRNPFNSIINLTDMIIKRFENYSTTQIKHFISDINKSSKEAYYLLDNLLNWSRSQTNRIEINRENIDLLRVTEENIALITQSANAKGIILQTEVTSPIYAFADFNTINTVARNLLSNALKFTSKGGRITISAIVGNDFVEYIVEDTGVGISEENRNKLFKLDVNHSTAGTSNEIGTGLGLILCNEFVRKNDGTIRVESTVGKGSKFIICLPKGNENNEQSNSIQNTATEVKEADNQTFITIENMADEMGISESAAQLVLDKMENKFMPQYLTVVKNNRIKEYISFGDEIASFGKVHGMKSLEKLGLDIISKANCYDITGLEESMGSFNDIIQTLKNSLQILKN